MTTSTNVSRDTRREEPAETGSTRRKCAADGTRGSTSTTSDNVSEETRRREPVATQVRCAAKQVCRGNTKKVSRGNKVERNSDG